MLRQPLLPSGDELFQVQQVLRPVLRLGPPAGRIELHADEIADLAVREVARDAGEIALRPAPANYGIQGDSRFQLQTGARCRNVFQNG